MRDLVTGLLLAVLMAVLLREAASLPTPRYEPLGAIFLAVLIPSLIFGFSLLLTVRGVRELRRDADVPRSGKLVSRDNLRFAATLATGFVWLLAMQLGVPFGVATFGFVTVCAFVLGAPNSAGTVGLTLGVALVLSFGMEFVFLSYLDVILP
jgi:putative tricarboxylic transport membrane protein